MRKRAMSVDEVKENIDSLRGEALKISVNKGRKKIVRYDGRIKDVFPSVFTLSVTGNKNVNMLSFSYSDVICGDIKLKPN